MGFQGVIFEFVQNIAGITIISILVGSMILLISWVVFESKKTKSAKLIPLPPGPPALPIIGNLHMLGTLPHRRLRELSQKYGPLMYLRLGSVPTVVASSPEVAKEILQVQDLNFASRPPTTVGRNMIYNFTGVAFTPYGPYWTQMRKACMSGLLSSKRLESLKFIREEEISNLIHSIWEHCLKGSNPADISKLTSVLATNILCRMAFGRKYPDEALDGKGFKALSDEFLYLAGAINIGEFIPWLEWMDLQGLGRRQKNCHKTFDAFLDKVIDEHIQQQDLLKDLVDTMLEISEDKEMNIKITRDNIKAVILEMLIAGTEPSAMTIEWAMSELLKSPSAMMKVKEELESAIGVKRKVEECDLPQLRYLNAVVKETLRLHPAGPLLLPHESVEACTVGGYHIPRKARVIVNVWAIHMDPTSWEDSEKFRPERFIGSSVDVRGQNFEMIPFGSGRRGCPGSQLALLVVAGTLANLVHCFDWRLPDGMEAEELDMREKFGLTTPRAVNLLAVPTARFP